MQENIPLQVVKVNWLFSVPSYEPQFFIAFVAEDVAEFINHEVFFVSASWTFKLSPLHLLRQHPFIFFKCIFVSGHGNHLTQNFSINLFSSKD